MRGLGNDNVTLLYLLVSCLIGTMLVIDAVILKKHEGSFHDNNTLNKISSIEFLWVLFSIYILIVINDNEVFIFLPIIYIVYYILGWVYGIYVLIIMKVYKRNMNVLFVPKISIKIELYFGYFFLFLSLILLIYYVT